jgi:undecaprenyl-diphosphatase
MIVLATIPVGLTGIALEHTFRTIFAKPAAAAVFLLVNGLILLAGERFRRARPQDREPAEVLAAARPAPPGAHARQARGRQLAEIRAAAASDARIARLPYRDTLFIGVLQIAALLAGISRSGVTMAGGLWRGLDHEDAARFAFLLATLPILAAGVLKLPSLAGTADAHIHGQILLGVIVTAITAYLSVRFLVRWFQTRTLTPFAIYCLTFGGLSVLRFAFSATKVVPVRCKLQGPLASAATRRSAGRPGSTGRGVLARAVACGHADRAGAAGRIGGAADRRAELFTENVAGAARQLGITVFAAAFLLAGAEPEEMITAVVASGRHRPGLVAGDAIGANLTMLTLVLGLAALARPLPFGGRVRGYALWSALAGGLAALAVAGGSVQRWQGALLVAAYLAGVTLLWWREREPPAIGELAESGEDSQDGEPRPAVLALALALGGLGLMVAGGWLAVGGAERVVAVLGLSDSAVGLTLAGAGHNRGAVRAGLGGTAPRRGGDRRRRGDRLGRLQRHRLPRSRRADPAAGHGRLPLARAGRHGAAAGAARGGAAGPAEPAGRSPAGGRLRRLGDRRAATLTRQQRHCAARLRAVAATEATSWLSSESAG